MTENGYLPTSILHQVDAWLTLIVESKMSNKDN